MMANVTVHGWSDMVSLLAEREAFWKRARLCRLDSAAEEVLVYRVDASERICFPREATRDRLANRL